MAAVFYRAVSLAELADFRASGELRIGLSSCEGKHLACTLEHARRWGEALYGSEEFAVLRVRLDDAAAAGLHRWERLDGIGPACFATMEQLTGAEVAEVRDEA